MYKPEQRALNFRTHKEGILVSGCGRIKRTAEGLPHPQPQMQFEHLKLERDRPPIRAEILSSWVLAHDMDPTAPG